MAQLVSHIMVIARAMALLLLCAATGCALHRWAWIPLRCAHAASVGGAALEAAAQRGEYEKQILVRRVRADLEGCARISPPRVAIPFTLGAAAEVTGDPRTAIAEYERALRIDRRPEIYFRLGLVQLQALEHSAGIESLTRACAFDPALLAEIPYKEVKQEVEQQLLAKYPPDWIR